MGRDHFATFLALARPAHCQTSLGTRDADVHQAPLLLQALQNAFAHGAISATTRLGIIAQLEGQHALGDANQHDMRPLQTLGSVQGRQRQHILLDLTLVDG